MKERMRDTPDFLVMPLLSQEESGQSRGRVFMDTICLDSGLNPRRVLMDIYL